MRGNLRTALAFAGMTFALAACGAEAERTTAEPSEPVTFDVAGTFSLIDADGVYVDSAQVEEDDLDGEMYYPEGTECSGLGGYSDIRAGAQVVIRDAQGRQVALGALSSGSLGEAAFDGAVLICDFEFVVAGVPDTDEIYSVEVTHRGEISFKKSQATGLQLTL